MNSLDRHIIDIVRSEPELSSSDIHTRLSIDTTLLTIKRHLTDLTQQHWLIKTGTGKATRYQLNPASQFFIPIDTENYFQQEIDARQIITSFNWPMLRDVLPVTELFDTKESDYLEELRSSFQSRVLKLSKSLYQQELQRLAIDLSWKSSQIEGNTYSLLETEQLLIQQREAPGKKKEEAIMLLNHKAAIDYIVEDVTAIMPLTVAKIESIHSILMRDLDVDRNIRQGFVGITGTNYRPPDNEFQIREALQALCDLINHRENYFERSLLTLLLISYIQPFADGNKRTARIIANAILMHGHCCPISFRTVDPVDYKKSLLLFYEQNHISAFKKMFIEQVTFAVNTYFQ